MKRRDIVIGTIILLLIGGVVYFRNRNPVKEEQVKVPETLSTQSQIEQKFKLQIPEDVEKADLKDVSGGNGTGLATRKFANSKFTFSILADLPDPAKGSFYQGWIVRGKEGDSNYSLISVGKLKSVKGGWMSDYTSPTDLSDHSNVWVTEEKIFNNTPETHVLEGNF